MVGKEKSTNRMATSLPWKTTPMPYAMRTSHGICNSPTRAGKKTCDDGSGVGVWERARTDHLVIVPLADGSFLAHSPDANYIVRFDEHLGTRYSNGKRVFVVDTEWIERIKEEVSEGLPYFGRAQEINDKVNQSILDLIK